MDILTSLNFDQERYCRIEKLVSNYNGEIEQLIKTCLRKLAPQIRKNRFNTGSLTYQPTTLNYEPLPFTMSNAEYEIYMDLKKISKCSLSLLVAIALDLYAESVIRNADSDSYIDYTYKMFFNIYKKFPMYIFYWTEEVKGEKPYYHFIE
jgi:hypothetical protein